MYVPIFEDMRKTRILAALRPDVWNFKAVRMDKYKHFEKHIEKQLDANKIYAYQLSYISKQNMR